MRTLGCLLVALSLPLCALAQEAVELPEIGARFYLADERTLAITRQSLDEQEATLSAMGLSVATVRETMQREKQHLLLFAPDGAQLALEVLEKPEGVLADEAWQLSEQEKQTLLDALTRAGHFATAAWPENANGFALFRQAPPSEGAAVALDVLAVSTLYRGKVYTLRMDVIGRGANEADEGALLSAARRFLRLGLEPEEVFPEGEGLALPTAQSSEDTPLALSQTSGVSGKDKFPLYGLTVPGATVQMLRKGRVFDLNVKADGSFTCRVTPNANGNTNFIIRATADGYQPTNIAVCLTPAVTDEKDRKRLERGVTEVRHARLLENPERFAEKLLECSGTVAALGQTDGRPCYLVQTEAGEGYLIQCDSLKDVALGAPVRALATALGENADFESIWAIGRYPLLQQTYRYDE